MEFNWGDTNDMLYEPHGGDGEQECGYNSESAYESEPEGSDYGVAGIEPDNYEARFDEGLHDSDDADDDDVNLNEERVSDLQSEGYEDEILGEGDMGAEICCISIDSLQDVLCIDLKKLCPIDTAKYDFANADVAYLFYKWYGRVNGFAVRKSNILRDKGGEVIQRRYVCSREGKRIDNNNRVREVRAETRCWCLAEFVVHIDCGTGKWVVKRFVDSHSHDLLPDEYSSMVAAHRGMSEAEILQMNNMRKMGFRGSEIFKSFAGQSGGIYNVGFSFKDMQNQITRQRRWEVSDATAAVDYIRGLQNHDSMIYYREKADEEGRLDMLFWTDGISQMSYQVFGDVLAFDATYCKNKHECPFVVFCGINHHNKTTIFASAIVSNESEETYVWLLDNFLRAMRGKAPSSVITDGCLSMRNAIKKVFPMAHHRLCAWHLQKGASKNVGIADFTRQLSKCMYFDLEVSEFEELWADIVAKYGLEANEWVTNLYEKKKMWAAAHIRGHFFAGLRTTSRCEGMNSQIGRFVNSGHSLVEFVEHFQRLLSYMRYKEVELDFKSSYGEVVLQTPLRSLERSASTIFTRDIYLLIRPVLARAGAMRVISCNHTFTCDIYTVSNCGVVQKQWFVSHYEPTAQFSCSCLRMESFGLPCVHLISVLAHLNILEFPKCLILHRWTKSAKECIRTSDNHDSHDNFFWEAQKVCQYSSLIDHCQRMSKMSLVNDEDIQQTTNIVIARIQELKDKHGTKCTQNEETTNLATPNVGGRLLNPARRVRNAGVRPSVAASGSRPRRLQKCSHCKTPGHNIKSCPELRSGGCATQEL